MERTKFASGKKTEPTETKHRRLPRHKAERKLNAEKLVCRCLRLCRPGAELHQATRSAVSEVFQQAVQFGGAGEEGEE